MNTHWQYKNKYNLYFVFAATYLCVLLGQEFTFFGAELLSAGLLVFSPFDFKKQLHTEPGQLRHKLNMMNNVLILFAHLWNKSTTTTGNNNSRGQWKIQRCCFFRFFPLKHWGAPCAPKEETSTTLQTIITQKITISYKLWHLPDIIFDNRSATKRDFH